MITHRVGQSTSETNNHSPDRNYPRFIVFTGPHLDPILNQMNQSRNLHGISLRPIV